MQLYLFDHDHFSFGAYLDKRVKHIHKVKDCGNVCMSLSFNRVVDWLPVKGKLCVLPCDRREWQSTKKSER